MGYCAIFTWRLLFSGDIISPYQTAIPELQCRPKPTQLNRPTLPIQTELPSHHALQTRTELNWIADPNQIAESSCITNPNRIAEPVRIADPLLTYRTEPIHYCRTVPLLPSRPIIAEPFVRFLIVPSLPNHGRPGDPSSSKKIIDELLLEVTGSTPGLPRSTASPTRAQDLWITIPASYSRVSTMEFHHTGSWYCNDGTLNMS